MSESNEQEPLSRRRKPSAASEVTRPTPARLLLLALAAVLVAGVPGAAHAQEGTATEGAAIDSSLFEHHYITKDLPGDRSWGYGTPALADFDNDDDLDFAFSMKQDTVYWFENQGTGQGAISWKRHALGTIPIRSLGGTALDVDQDGWTDLVVGGYWYRNPGTPRRAAFTRYRYDASIDTEIHDIVAADVNGDDRLEVVVTGDEEGAYWYATPGDPMQNADWPRHTITEAVTVENDSIHAAFAPKGVADLDGDGDADVVMPDRWYENQAQGTRWVAHDLPFGKRGPWGLSSRSWVADMDQDGDADIVMVDADQKQSRAAWLENDGGDPPQFTRHPLPQEAAGERGSFHSLAVADFDEDQDLDVFAVEQEDGSIFPAGAPPRWYVWENLDGKGQEFAERVVFDGRLGGHDALAGDVDGDGDVDIVSKVWTRWEENANAGREHADLLENLAADRLSASAQGAASPAQTSSSAQARAAERPNILFAISDDQSWPHASAYGTPWVETPAFDRVAREGLLFNRAYTPNAKCAPSRAAILTGRNSWQLGAAANHWPFWPDRFGSYVEALEAHGYFGGSTGKGWAPGIARTDDGETRYLAGVPFEEYTAEPPAEHISTNDYAANFEAFLDERPDGEPFVFWYGAREPHRRYEYGAGRREGGKQPGDIDRVPSFYPDTDTVRTDMLDYAFEIEHFDRHLGRMLETLEERGELENTLVVVTSDNGMPFPRIKGQEYERSNHLPLAIMWPEGIGTPGRVIEDHVSFIDFAPTFLEVAGVEQENTHMQPITGRSLTDIFRSEEAGQVNPERDHVLIGKERHDVGRPGDKGYPTRGLVTDDYLYLRNFEPERWPVGNPETGYLNTDGSPTKTQLLNMPRGPETVRYWRWSFGKRPPEELYRIASDPFVMANIAGNPVYRALQERMRARLFSALEAQGDPRMRGRGKVFDEYPYANDAGRNFYERFMEGELSRGDAGWVSPSDFEPNLPDSLRQVPGPK